MTHYYKCTECGYFHSVLCTACGVSQKWTAAEIAQVKGAIVSAPLPIYA